MNIDRKQFFRNATKSTKYMVDDILKKSYPATYSALNLKNSMSKVNKEIRDAQIEAKRIENANSIPRPEVKGNWVENLVEDVKSGNFYNKSRIKSMNDDFDKANNGSFEKDFTSSLDTISSSFDSLNSTLHKQANLSVTICKTQLEANRQDMIFKNAIERQRHIETIGLSDAMNQNLVNMVEFNNEKFAPYLDQSLKFYQDSIFEQRAISGTLKNILDIQVKMTEASSAVSPVITDKDNMQKLFSGGAFNLEEYYRHIRTKLSDYSPIGILMSLLGNGDGKKNKSTPTNVLTPNFFDELTASPVSKLLSMLGVPNKLKKELESLEGGVSGLPASVILKLLNVEKSEDFDKILKNAGDTKLGKLFKLDKAETQIKTKANVSSILKDIFGISTDTEYKLDKFERGPMAFNGITQKAITSVIPNLLAKIYQAVSGEEDRLVVDYNRGGKLLYASQKRKEVNSTYSNAATAALGDFNKEMNNMINHTNMSGDDRNKVFDDLSKLNTWLAKGNILDINNPKVIEEIKKISPEYHQFFISLVKQLPMSVMNKLPYNQLVGMSALSAVSRQFEADADNSGLSMLESESELNSKNLVKDINKVNYEKLIADKGGKIDEASNQFDDLNDSNIGLTLANRIEAGKTGATQQEKSEDGKRSILSTITTAPLNAAAYTVNSISKILNRLIYGHDEEGRGLIEGLYNRFSGLKEKLKDWGREKVGQIRDKWNESEIGQYINERFTSIKEWFNGKNEDGFGANFKRSIKEVYDFGIDSIKNAFGAATGVEKEDISLMSTIDLFKTKLTDFKTYLFGDEEKDGVFHSEYVKGFKDLGLNFKDFGKAAGSAAVGALGSIFLPGGPLLWGLIGGGNSFINASEKLKEKLFGTEEAEGLVPREVVDAFPDIKKGAGIGMVAGLIARNFLPGGPFTGALLGSMFGYMRKTEAFSKLFFGKDKDGNKTGEGLIDKVKNTLYDTIGGKIHKFFDTQMAKFSHTFDKYLFVPIKNAIQPVAKAFIKASTNLVMGLAKMLDRSTGGILGKVMKGLGKGLIGGLTKMGLGVHSALSLGLRTNVKAVGTGIDVISTMLAKYGMSPEEYEAWKAGRKDDKKAADRRLADKMRIIKGKSYTSGDFAVVDTIDNSTEEVKTVVEDAAEKIVVAIKDTKKDPVKDVLSFTDSEDSNLIGEDFKEQQIEREQKKRDSVLENIEINTRKTAENIDDIQYDDDGKSTLWDALKNIGSGIFGILGSVGKFVVFGGAIYEVLKKFGEGKSLPEAAGEVAVEHLPTSGGMRALKKGTDFVEGVVTGGKRVLGTGAKIVKGTVNLGGRVGGFVADKVTGGKIGSSLAKGDTKLTTKVASAVKTGGKTVLNWLVKQIDDVLKALCKNKNIGRFVEPIYNVIKKALPEIGEKAVKAAAKVGSSALFQSARKLLGYAEIAFYINDAVTGFTDYKNILHIPNDTPWDKTMAGICAISKVISGLSCGFLPVRLVAELILKLMGKGDKLEQAQQEFYQNAEEAGFGDNIETYNKVENPTFWQKVGTAFGLVDSRKDIIQKEIDSIKEQMSELDPDSEQYKALQERLDLLTKTFEETTETWYEKVGNFLEKILINPVKKVVETLKTYEDPVSEEINENIQAEYNENATSADPTKVMQSVKEALTTYQQVADKEKSEYYNQEMSDEFLALVPKFTSKEITEEQYNKALREIYIKYFEQINAWNNKANVDKEGNVKFTIPTKEQVEAMGGPKVSKAEEQQAKVTESVTKALVNPIGGQEKDPEQNNTTGMGGQSDRHMPIHDDYDNAKNISSGFGQRTFRGQVQMHPGVDYAAPKGTPIYSAADGVAYVAKYGDNGGWGNYVRVRHNDGYETVYGHASKLNIEEGATVKAGQKIAEVGTTGNSTGNHLHFGVYKTPKDKSQPKYLQGYVDPISWLQGAKASDGSVSASPSTASDGNTTTEAKTNTDAIVDSSVESEYSKDIDGIIGAISDWFKSIIMGTEFTGRPGNASPEQSVATTPTIDPLLDNNKYTSASAKDFLGKASVKYETGVENGDPAFVSRGNEWGDPGGISYGIPQFATNTGSAKTFVTGLMADYPVYKRYFQGKTPGTSSFGTAWKQAARDRGDEFMALQMDSVYDDFYTPWIKQMKNTYGVDMNKDRALQEAAYSISVQHGMNSAKKYGEGVKNSMTTEQALDKLYENRRNKAGYPTIPRWNKEINDVKAYAGKSPIGYKDSDFLNKFLKSDAQKGGPREGDSMSSVKNSFSNDFIESYLGAADEKAMGGPVINNEEMASNINDTLNSYYRDMSDQIQTTVNQSETGLDAKSLSNSENIMNYLAQIAKNTGDTVAAVVKTPGLIAELVSKTTEGSTVNVSNNTTVNAGGRSSSGGNIFMSQVDKARSTATDAMRKRALSIAKGN